MAKKIKFNIIDFESQHYKEVEKYVKQLEKLYDQLAKDAGKLGASITNLNSDKPFSFSDYPQTREPLDKLLSTLAENITLLIQDGSNKEWLNSSLKNDALVKTVFDNEKIKSIKLGHLYERNMEALAAFQERKTNGMGLSQKVWNLTEQVKQELEMAIDIGLTDARSAAQLSKDIREYLNEPSKLFRRVKDKNGVLQLSKNAKAYNPGQGVYRSSAQNAKRLTRTEINMAYRTSDFTRWQQLDFIIGYEIRRSKNGKPCPVCDALVGCYPKNFKFVGFHPQCFCYAIPLFADMDEYLDYENMMMAGDDVSEYAFSGEIDKLPDNFISWSAENEGKIKTAKSVPYFIKDNFKELNVSELAPAWNTDKPVKIPTSAAKEPPAPVLSEHEIKQMKFMEYEKTYAAKKLKQAEELGITGAEYDNLVAALKDDSLTYSQIATKSNKLLQQIKAEKAAKLNPYSQEALEKIYNKDEVKGLLDAFNKHLSKKNPDDLSNYITYLNSEIDWIKKHTLTKYKTSPKLLEMLENELKVIKQAEIAKEAALYKEIAKTIKPTKGTLEVFYTKEELSKIRTIEKEIDLLRKSGTHSWDSSIMDKQNKVNDLKKDLALKYYDKTPVLKHLDKMSDAEYAKFLKEHIGSHRHSMSDKYTIEKYMKLTGLTKDELSLPVKYTGSYYSELNRALRGTPGDKDKQFAIITNRTLEKLPRFEGVLRRGLSSGKVLPQLQEAFNSGKPWVDKGFFSTSMRGKGFSGDLKLLIHSKSGAILEDISQFGKGEAEVLLRAGSKFKVISLYQSGGSWYAELEEIL